MKHNKRFEQTPDADAPVHGNPVFYVFVWPLRALLPLGTAQLKRSVMSHRPKCEGTHNGNAGRASSLSENSIPWLVWVGEGGSVLISALGRLSPAGFAAPWTPAETRPLGGRPYRLARCDTRGAAHVGEVRWPRRRSRLPSFAG